MLLKGNTEVSLMEPELLTFSGHLGSPLELCNAHVARSLVFHERVVFCRSLFVLLSFFPLVVVSPGRLQFTTSDYL